MMGNITLSHRLDEDDHKAVQIVNMDPEEEEPQCVENFLSSEPIQIEGQPKVNPHDFMPISILGKGSFGEVYLVEKNFKDLFAMKVLSKEKIMGNNYIKYAMTERNVLSYTHHPFIVKLNYSF
jgi:serine/threonine protein kinase